MLSLASISTIVFCYLLLLFLVGLLGDKYLNRTKPHPLIYSLALGVHCTSWAFFGTTTQATQYGWAFIPTYLGVILVMLFGYGSLQKIAQICKQNNISSLADFIGLHYKGSFFLTALVTVFCFLGVVPYIALQLDSVVDSLNLLAGETQTTIGLYVAIALAALAIVLGARTFDLSEKKPGLMLTVAMASLIKLVALAIVGLFVCYSLFDGVFDLLGKAQLSARGQEILDADTAPWVYASHILLGICAMFCLPRQFHVNFVEFKADKELATARWVLPLYLVGMTIFVLPIGFAGHIIFAQQPVSTDSYALALPLYAQSTSIALVSFIGGLAAAASMVVVATLAVGIMISNNVITPLWVKLKLVNQHQTPLSPRGILFIRRITIASVIGAAYLYHRDVSSGSPLVNSGIIAMALLAQTLPMILLSLYWPKANRVAATVGLLVGALCWSIWLVWPSITSSYYFNPIPTDLELGQGFVLSLVANVLCFVVITLIFPALQSSLTTTGNDTSHSPISASIKLNRLLALTKNVLSEEQQALISAEINQAQEQDYASPKLIAVIDNALAAKIGGASSRILISAIAEKDHMALPELVEWMEEATQTFQFNHEILQSSVEHIQQGISVVDPDLQLIAWNQRYIELFDYPEGFIRAGIPMQELLVFNAKRGLFGDAPDIQAQIEKRISYIKSGSHYKYVRKQPSGQMIELNGGPLPGGGYVTTYSDISEYIAIQNQLEQAKSSLEQRVETRTKELNQSNQALSAAKLQAEQANESKTKFLAAAGHDLMQPFNAASLFAELIKQKADNPELHQLSQSLNESLHNAEELLSLLLDMTKLESGILQTHFQHFCIDDLLRPLATEFSIIAKQKGLKFSYVPCSLMIHSDKTLLRRIIQNLLSNAVRYTQSGRILLGCKRKGQHLALCVADTGPGISKSDQTLIFKEFKQLNQQSNHQGLGLGLTIVEKITRLLEHPLSLLSTVNKGSTFTVSVPFTLHSARSPKPLNSVISDSKPLVGKTVLLAENDEQTRVAVIQLLSSWGAKIEIVHRLVDITSSLPHIDLMLLDYHLDDAVTGIDVANAVRRIKSATIPGILNSSERSEKVRSDALDGELLFLPKPLKSAAFKRLLRKLDLVDNG